MIQTLSRCIAIFAVLSASTHVVDAFSSPSCSRARRSSLIHNKQQFSPVQFQSSTLLFEKKTEYSREVILREEAESPFRKVRFFLYFALGGGALVSLAVSLARVAAGLNGINTELLGESATNAAIDAAGLIVIAIAYQRDLQAQESRLKRATKGAELAKLNVRVSKSIVSESLADYPSSKTADKEIETFTTTLASLRRGRGIEKRVVIAAAGADKIAQVVQQATSESQYKDSLIASDLLVVPVVMPQGVAPTVSGDLVATGAIALPVGNGWKTLVEDEAQEAIKQGVDIEKEGFCVILKKNGRVGQRTRGIFLNRMVGEVADRETLGMDIKNI